jgi:ribosomal protein L40E
MWGPRAKKCRKCDRVQPWVSEGHPPEGEAMTPTGNAVTGPGLSGPGSPAPEGRWRSVGYRRAHLRARWNYLTFGGLLFAGLALLVLHAQMIGLIDRVSEGQYVSEAEGVSLDDAIRVASGGYFIFFVATAVTFLAWLSRSVENARPLGAGTPVRSPREAIGWWFVPFASLWVPYQIVRDLFERLALKERAGKGALVVAWWIVFLVSSWVGQIVARLATTPDPTLEQLRNQVSVTLLSYLIDIVGIALALWLIHEIQTRAEGRAAALGLRADDAVWPAAVSTSLPAAQAPVGPAAFDWAAAPGATTPTPAPGSAVAADGIAFCPGCGRPRPVGGRFCAGCGRDLGPPSWAPFAAPAPMPAAPTPPVTDGDSEDLEQTRVHFDALRLELAKGTNDWKLPVVVRSYDPGDDGHEDYEDEAMLFEEHGYDRSFVQEEAALTATYRKTTGRVGSPAISEAAFCPKCGAARPDGAAFCPKCGAHL